MKLRRTMLNRKVLALSVMATFSMASLTAGQIVEDRPIFAQDSSREDHDAGRMGGPTLQQNIDQLIKELGSNSYATRQFAAERIWDLGVAAIPGLERAAAHNDSEVARRVKKILSVLQMGIDSNTSPEIAKLVLQYYSGEQNMRVEVLTRLVSEGQFQLVFDLLSQIKDDDDQRYLFDEALDFDDTLIRLARADRWDQFEFILGHSLTFKNRASASLHFHLNNGTLPTLIRRQCGEIKTRESEGKTLTAGELFRLIGIFRLQGDYEQALTYAKKITEDELRTGILNQLLLEQGDWHAIAEKMAVTEENGKSINGKIVVTPAQRALVNQFVGNQTGYDETVSELRQQADDFHEENDLPAEQEIRETLLQIGMANLDWPLVESNLDLEEKFKAFRLYIFNNRSDKAFEIVGLGSDVEQRNLWFTRRVANMESLESESKRLEEKGQTNDEVNTRLSKTWENSFQVAVLLGNLGLTDETASHLQTLFAALESDDQKYRRFNLMQELVELERYETVWKLIENGFDSSQHRQLISYIFPNRESDSRFWYDRIKNRYPDPLERLRVTSGILNSPLGSTPTFDLQIELASAFSYSASTPNLDYYFGNIYEFHGNEELSRRHMKIARDLGLDVALRSHALESFEAGDNKSAIEFFDSTWRTRQSCFETILAAESLRQTGDLKSAMLRDCLAYAMWRDNFRNTGTMISLESIDKSHLIEEILKLEIIPLDKVSFSNERYRDQLALAQLKSDPGRGAINFQLALFNAASGGAGTRSMEYWSESRKQINMALAQSNIAKGHFAEALQLLLQFNKFCPGDPEIGQKFISEFDRAEATRQADVLFENLTQPYFEILARYPDSPFHHNNYAWICACGNRRTQHMLRHSLKAASERPNSSTFKDTLAEIYFLLGKTETAIELCRRCIEINPANGHYRQQLNRFKTGLK